MKSRKNLFSVLVFKNKFIKVLACFAVFFFVSKALFASYQPVPLTWTINSGYEYIADEHLLSEQDGKLEYNWPGGYVRFGFYPDQVPALNPGFFAGIVISGTGDVEVKFNNGATYTYGIAISLNDHLQIKRNGGIISFSHNGSEFYSLNLSSSQVLYPYAYDHNGQKRENLRFARSYIPTELEVAGSAIFTGNEVLLRWTPADYETWKWGNEHGYTVERRRVDVGAPSSEVEVISTSVAPLPPASWPALMATHDMAKVAHKMIYEDSLEAQYLEGANFMTIVEVMEGRENMMMFCMLAADRDFDVAVAAGVGFVDNTALPGVSYLYTVTPNNVPAGTELKKATFEMATTSVNLMPPPFNLTARGSDKFAAVGWEKNDEYYGSYLIERSDDNGATWEQVNDSPYLSSGSTERASYGDSLAANNTLYIYRVKGCSPFGIVGPVSDTVHVYGKPGPLKDAYPVFIDVEELTPGSLTLNWEFPLELESEIQGFEIHRSDKQEGLYVKISTSMLTVTARSYVDAQPLPANYYKVVVIDDNGHEISSVAKLAQPNDSTPPSAPASISGTSNSSGIVTLNWARSPEADVKGYRVFLSNQAEGGFTQITTTWLNDTIYQYGLNLNTLSEDVYFAVKAVDFRENLSEFSPVCTVERPDIIPPAPPSISNVQPNGAGIDFTWDLSSSEDVVEYKFQRKPNGRPGWVTVFSFLASEEETEFYDEPESNRIYYDYRLLAIDDAGLIGSSDEIKAKPVDNGMRGTISDFDAYLNINAPNEKVILEWEYDAADDPDLDGFQVFRSFDDGPLQSYVFVNFEDALANGTGSGINTTFAFLDKDLDLDIPLQNNFMSNGNENTVFVGGLVTRSAGVTTINPTNPNTPRSPFATTDVKYAVMAKHFDGGFSDMTDLDSVAVDPTASHFLSAGTNPCQASTTLDYSLDVSSVANEARVIVQSDQGTEVLNQVVTGSSGQVSFSCSSFSTGDYTCFLLVDGSVIISFTLVVE